MGLIVALTAFYVVLFWLPKSVQISEQNLEVSTHRELSIATEGLISPLLQNELAAIHESLDALLEQFPEWIILELYDQKRDLIYPIVKKTFQEKIGYRTFDHAITIRGEEVAFLVVTVDFGPQLAIFQKQTNELFGLLALSLALGLVGILLFIELFITKPVRDLAHAAEELANENFMAALPEDRGDEIGALISKFAVMRTNIQASAEKLLQNEQQLRDFGAAASDWYWEMNENLRFSYFSDSFTDVTGVSQDILLGKTRQENGNPGAEEEQWQEHLETLASHRPFRNFIHPRTLPNGNVVWLSINGKPVFDEDGHFGGYRGTGLDVTGVKKSQQRLLDLSAAIDEMSEPVVVFDSDDRFIFTNEAYRKINKTVIDSIQIGNTFEDYIRAVVKKGLAPDSLGCEETWITERVARHRTPSGYFEVKREDGIWFLGVEKKLPTGGQVLLLTDISEIKKTQQELVLAKEESESANQAKSDFLSSMSHELRTPMNAILGFGQMLDFNPKEPLTKAQKDCVDHIMKGGQHLLDLINDVLDLAKIEAGKVEFSIEDIQVAGVIDECLLLVKEMAAKRDITIIVPDSDTDMEAVRADFTRLKQVLLNLISNAIKYNNEGGSVTVSYMSTADGVGRISVTDTGDGIPQSRQGELFKAFSRLVAENSEIEGTGIGLVVCKELVELMDGSIGFESQEGKGSTFWFDLPLSTEQSRKVDAGDVKGFSRGEEWLQEINGTMLYVEDNPSNLRLMEMIVSRIEGLSMLSAHTAELGIEIAKSKIPDVIILDINLPGMDGFEALKELRSLDETMDIPVLALSAAATKHNIEQGMKAGFRNYLTKPMQVLEVTDAIKKALGG